MHRTRQQTLVLLFHPNIIINQHLHIETVMSLLRQTPQQLLILTLCHLQLHIPLNFLNIDPGLPYLLQSLTMLSHITQDSGLIQISRHYIIPLLLFIISYQLLLHINCKTHGLQSHHIVFHFLKNTRQIVKCKDLQLTKNNPISYILRHLRQHNYIDCFCYKLRIPIPPIILNILHSQTINLLHQIDYLLLQTILQLHLTLPLQHQHR